MDTSIPPQKQCSKCTHWLPATTEYFYARKGTRDGLYSNCKECAITYSKTRDLTLRTSNKAHSEEKYARQQIYLQEHDAEIQAYWQAHKEAQIAKQKANCRIYQQTHPERCKAAAHKHRALKLQAQGTHTAQDIQKQYKNQQGKCYYCRKKVGITYDVDHVIPLSKGGTNDPSNLVIACPHCNRSKCDKIVRLL